MVPGACIILNHQAIVLCFLLTLHLHFTVLYSEGHFQFQLSQVSFLHAEVICSIS